MALVFFDTLYDAQYRISREFPRKDIFYLTLKRRFTQGFPYIGQSERFMKRIRVKISPRRLIKPDKFSTRLRPQFFKVFCQVS
jgi:hypothetical protein